MSAKVKKRRAGQDNLKYEIIGVLLFTAAIFITVSLFTSTGIIGNSLIYLLTILTGKTGCFLVAGMLVYFSCSCCWLRRPFWGNSRNKGVILLFFIALVILHLRFLPAGGIPRDIAIALLWDNGLIGAGGGVLGAVLSISSLYLLARTGTLILTAALSIISLTLLTGIPLSKFMKRTGNFFINAGRSMKAGLERFLFVEEDTFAETVKNRTKREEKKEDTPVIIDYNAHPSAMEEEPEEESLEEEEGEKTSFSVTRAPWIRRGLMAPTGIKSISPLPRSFSAPPRSRIVRESVCEDTAKAMREGMFALITPVITSTEGRCVAITR